jgi:hypothetical protein
MTGTTVTGSIASGEVFDLTSTTGQTAMTSSGMGQRPVGDPHRRPIPVVRSARGDELQFHLDGGYLSFDESGRLDSNAVAMRVVETMNAWISRIAPSACRRRTSE